MATMSEQRHDLIHSILSRQPDAIVDVSIHLWETLTLSLVSIIGEDGFQSLLTRSIYLNKTKFPWLALYHATQAVDSPFAGLKISLETRAASEASAASIALLSAFVDLLALLIGDHMTTGIMRSAWGEADIAPSDVTHPNNGIQENTKNDLTQGDQNGGQNRNQRVKQSTNERKKP